MPHGNGTEARLREHDRRLDAADRRAERTDENHVQIMRTLARLEQKVDDLHNDQTETKEEVTTVRRSFYIVAVSIVASAVGFAFTVLLAFGH